MTSLDDDVARIMAVMQSAFDPHFGEAWTHYQVLDALVIGNCHYRLVDATGQECAEGAAAAGFYLARKGFEEEELLLVGVDPQHRGKGIGTKLLEHLIATSAKNSSKRVFLEMRRGNTAESIYTALGFQPIGVRTNYYRCSDGSRLDALTFCLDI